MQGVAVALSGTVVHAQLLVDGLVVQDVTNTGQASVTLNTAFDSLNFADGYLLPVRMKVWDSAGNFYDATLTAPVRAPKIDVYDIWTNDYNPSLTNDLTPVSGSAGGTMGGNTRLHIRLKYPPFTTLTSLRLHFRTDPDTSRDVSLISLPMIAPRSSLCQDPDPALPKDPPAVYCDQGWNIGGRNGLYDVTATLQVTGAGGVVHTLTGSSSFDREDLIITGTDPVNPTPVLWDPVLPDATYGTVGGRYLQVNYSAAYRVLKWITLKIYSSDQTLVRTYNDFDNGWLASDQSSFLWDGRGELVNGQPGAVLPRGVYLFQWTVADTLVVTDTDKSPWLSISQNRVGVDRRLQSGDGPEHDQRRLRVDRQRYAQSECFGGDSAGVRRGLGGYGWD